MKKIKLLTLATVGIASIGLLAACSSKDNSSSKSTDKVTTVTVATSAASVPYEYSENGKMTGFEYDILKELSTVINSTLKSMKIVRF